MLVVVAILVLLYKNNVVKKTRHEFILSSDEIADLFIYILVFITLYWFIYGIIKANEEALVMGAVSATLFVGFSISLKEIFEIEKIRHIYKPFLQTFINIRNGIGFSPILIGLVLVFFLELSLCSCFIFIFLEWCFYIF